MIEEKGIYSIEKFLVSRRLMYWQVYLHKTVLCAEQMLQRIVKRAKFIKASTQTVLHKFINEPIETVTLQEFCDIDDNDVLTAIKEWSNHPDKVLSFLCKSIINRDLLKVKYTSLPVAAEFLTEKIQLASNKLQLSNEDAKWLVFKGEASTNTYNFSEDHILILFKDGVVKNITEVDNPLINENLNGSTKKYYICYLR